MGCDTSKPLPKQGLQVTFKQFPSPFVLSELQKKIPVSHTPPLDKNGNAIPSLPTTEKSDVYSPEDFTEQDLHVLQIDPVGKWKSYEELVKELTRLSSSDVGNVRAFYLWLISQNLGNLNVTNVPVVNTPAYDLLKVTLHLMDASEVFFKLCKIVKIPCCIINGKVKLTRYSIITNSTWCAAHVQDSWRLLDPSLGRFQVIKRNRPLSVLHTNIEGHPDGSSLDEDLIKDAHEFYFFTNPEHFIYSHFPQENKWQLLHRTVAESEFTQMVHLTKIFFELGIIDLSEPKAVITSEDGLVVISFLLPQFSRTMITLKLFKMVHGEAIAKVGGFDLSRYTRVEKSGSCLAATLELPKPGKYRLEVSGRSQEYASYSHVCDYTVLCQKTFTNCLPNPINCRPEWGPGCEMAKLGIFPNSHQGGVIYTESGDADITFCLETSTSNIEYLHYVNSDHMDRDELVNHSVHWIDGDMLCIHAKVPKPGKYMLKIFSKEFGHKHKPQNICNYLIISTAPCRNDTPYPIKHIGKFGASSVHLESVTHPSPVISLSGTNCLDIQLLCNRDVTLDPKFTLHAGTNSQDMTQYFWNDVDGKKSTISLRFLMTGMYSLAVTAKVKSSYSAVRPQCIYVYIITVENLSGTVEKFPQTLASWKSVYHVIQPLHYCLAHDNETEFVFDIPTASDVYLSYQGDKHILEKDTAELWKGSLKTGQEDIVKVMVTEDPAMPKAVMQFKVFSDDGEKDMQTYKAIADKAEQQSRNSYEQRKHTYGITTVSRESNIDATVAVENDIEEGENAAREKILAMEKERNETRLLSEGEQKKLMQEEVDSQIVASELDGFDAWRDTVEGMKRYMMLSHLREGIRNEDDELLCRTLKDVKHHSITGVEELCKAAEHKLIVIRMKKALQKAFDSQDHEAVTSCLEDIKAKNLLKDMSIETRQAMICLSGIKSKIRIMNLKSTILNMDKATMSEIRRYQCPPEVIHKVMVAVLLLTGEDELSTSDWNTCQKLCSPSGGKSIHRRIQSVMVEQLHPEIVSRAREILSEVSLESAAKVSAGANSFYIWALGIVEEAEKRFTALSGTQRQPASILRQREIFGKNSLPHYDANDEKGLSGSNKKYKPLTEKERAFRYQPN